MNMKLLSLPCRYTFNRYLYSSCSVKDILNTQPEGCKKKLKVIPIKKLQVPMNLILMKFLINNINFNFILNNIIYKYTKCKSK